MTLGSWQQGDAPAGEEGSGVSAGGEWLRGSRGIALQVRTVSGGGGWLRGALLKQAPQFLQLRAHG